MPTSRASSLCWYAIVVMAVSTGTSDRIQVQLLMHEIYPSLTSHPSQLSLAIPVGRHKNHQPMRGVTLQLGSEGRYASCLVAGKTK